MSPFFLSISHSESRGFSLRLVPPLRMPPTTKVVLNSLFSYLGPRTKLPARSYRASRFFLSPFAYGLRGSAFVPTALQFLSVRPSWNPHRPSRRPLKSTGHAFPSIGDRDPRDDDVESRTSPQTCRKPSSCQQNRLRQDLSAKHVLLRLLRNGPFYLKVGTRNRAKSLYAPTNASCKFPALFPRRWVLQAFRTARRLPQFPGLIHLMLRRPFPCWIYCKGGFLALGLAFPLAALVFEMQE